MTTAQMLFMAGVIMMHASYTAKSPAQGVVAAIFSLAFFALAAVAWAQS